MELTRNIPQVAEPEHPPHFCCLMSDREFEDMREELERIENNANTLTNASTRDTDVSRYRRPKKS